MQMHSWTCVDVQSVCCDLDIYGHQLFTYGQEQTCCLMGFDGQRIDIPKTLAHHLDSHVDSIIFKLSKTCQACHHICLALAALLLQPLPCQESRSSPTHENLATLPQVQSSKVPLQVQVWVSLIALLPLPDP